MSAPEVLSAEEVRRRAASGAALLGGRGVLIYTVGIAANLVLAGLLTPRDFGIVALGTVVVVVGTYLADSGFSAALVQREAPPSAHELQAILGLQLAVAVALAGGTAAVAAVVGGDAWVVAVMVASLPIVTLRVPSFVVLERELRYRVIAVADVVEALVYYAWAVGAVALGFGVWGMASAIVARAVAGTATMLMRGPLGPTEPRWSWRTVRPLLRFGAKVQVTALLLIGREQGLNVVIGAVAGLATLGIWNLAWRVVQVPNMLFLTLGRVTFPAVSRLLDAREDVRVALERGVAALAVTTAVVAVALVALGVALPDLVGDEWGDVSATLLWSGLALIAGAPVAVAASGYFYAAGRAGIVAIATLASAAAWFAVAAALLPEYGAPAAGVGWLAAGIVNTAILGPRLAADTGAAVGVALTAPTLAGLASGLGTWLIAQQIESRVAGGLVALVAGEALLLAVLAIGARGTLRETRSLAARSLRSLRPS